MSGLHLDGPRRTSNAQPPTTPTSSTFGPSANSGRTSPRLNGDGPMTSATTEAPSLSRVHAEPKRVQFIQANASTVHESMGPDGRREMMQHKVDQVFDQIKIMASQHLLDTRPGTTHIVSVPEFFWNTHMEHATPDEKHQLIGMLQDRVAQSGLGNALFLMGTVVTSEPPAMLAPIDPNHLPSVERILGYQNNELSQAFQEAVSRNPESFTQEPSDARIDLTSVASLAEAIAKKKEAPVSQEILERAAELIKEVRDNLAPVTILAGHMDQAALGRNLNHFLEQTTPEGMREAVQHICPSFDCPATGGGDRVLEKLKNFLADNRGNLGNVHKLARVFKDYVAPFKLSRTEYSGGLPTGRSAPRGLPTTFKLLQNSPEMDVAQLHEEGRKMFKAIRNEAIVLDGSGQRSPRLVSKFAPSVVDVPSYADAMNDKVHPKQRDSFRHLPGGMTPAHEGPEMTARLQAEGHNPSMQIVDLPGGGKQLGMVVCRDINSGHYAEHVSEALNDTEIFHLISGGINTGEFRESAPRVPIIARTDGHYTDSEVRFGATQRPVAGTAYRQSELGGTFGPVPKEEMYQRRLPGGPAQWQVSDTIHTQGAAPSSDGSFTDSHTEVEIPLLKKDIEHYQAQLDDLRREIGNFDRALVYMKEGGLAEKSNIYGMISFTPAQKQAWESEPKRGVDILHQVLENLQGDLNSVEARLQAKQKRLAAVSPPTT
ncbi:hypothetical protein [Acanthopleuribacter pedis]|uniref:Uncharacterized protein n=1 Tax=Acanthopleuribacter pedis TaxID=442870 RepID=A0A8J7QH62_9BACT|nr:hypothetical protein [Acanthopleuribacter pedis]MBO1322320.1 hypothetical protein [Acanthopleuribacter pedis]